MVASVFFFAMFCVCFLNSFISAGTTDQKVAKVQMRLKVTTFLYIEYDTFI